MITPEQLAASGSEDGHQTALFCWINQHKTEFPQLQSAFAIPNGGLRNIATAAKLKAMGVKKGVVDIFLPEPLKSKTGIPYHGMFLELKVGKNTTTDEQQQFIQDMEKRGYYCAVCLMFRD